MKNKNRINRSNKKYLERREKYEKRFDIIFYIFDIIFFILYIFEKNIWNEGSAYIS